MKIDFLLQNIAWLVIGLVAAKSWQLAQTRLRRQRIRHFFGTDALDEPGIVVTASALRPVSRDNFDQNAEKTIALKTNDVGKEVRLPIYEEMINFKDYQSTNEIFKLLREQGAKTSDSSLLPDSESLGSYQEKTPCLVCIGSPFVNATLGELLRRAENHNEMLIYADRTSNTLDTYRLEMYWPEHLSLGVDENHAIGVILRFPNPARSKDSIVAVWGCRAESTLETTRYFCRNFKEMAMLAEKEMPLIVLLAIYGLKLNVVEKMYTATNRTVTRNDTLLNWYLRSDTPDAASEGASRMEI